MDTWEKTEKRLAAIRKAGVEIVGEKLPAKYTGGPPRAEQIKKYERRERWIRKNWKWPEW